MKRGFLLLSLFLLLARVAGFAIDRNAFTITRYDLTVIVGPESHVLSATGEITLRNDSKSPQKNLVLQVSSSLKWDGVAIDKRDLEFLAQTLTSDIDHTGSLSEAIVNLPNAIPPGATITLFVRYGGAVLPDATRLTRIGVPQEIALHNDWDQVSESFTAVRGLGHVAWYPFSLDPVSMSEGTAVQDAIAHWSERHRNTSFHATILAESTKPTPLAIAFNSDSGLGERIPAPLPDADTSSVWTRNELKLDALNGTTPSFAIGSFTRLSRPTVDVIHTADHELIAKDYAIGAESNEALLNEWLPSGSKPVRVIELTDPNATPYQDGTTLFAPLLSSTQQNLQLLMLPTQVSVRSPSTRAWITNGLGLFLQAKAVEQKERRAGAMRFLQRYQQPLAKAEEPQTTTDSQSESSSKPARRNEADNTLLNTNDDVLLRVKGGYVLWMLSDMLGDSALQKALQKYSRTADNDPTQLQNLLQSDTKQNLEWFFDDWVYRDRGLPDFHIESAVTRKLLATSSPARPIASNAVLVTATVENLGDAGADVPVIVQTPSGEKSARTLIKAHEKVTVRIEVPEAPTRVVVNDGSVPERDTSNNVYTFETKPPS